MIRYIIKRIGYAVFVIWGVLTLTFAMIHLAPGNPTDIYVRPGIEPETVQLIQRQLGLDLPTHQQYLKWLTGIAQGDLGISFTSHQPVSRIMAEGIWNTLQLTLFVFLIQLIMGTVLGIISALLQGRKWDVGINALLLIFYSLPSFWLALMAIMVFSLKLGWFPSSQMASIIPPEGFWLRFLDRLHHLALPALVLAISLTAYTARFVRGSLIDVLAKPYIQTAKAYGLSRIQIIFKYALKNALLPLITLSGLYAPFILGGAVIVEYIFAWPGMGRITINAIFSHDYPVILASSFLAAISVIIGNTIADICYRIADPRIEYLK